MGAPRGIQKALWRTVKKGHLSWTSSPALVSSKPARVRVVLLCLVILLVIFKKHRPHPTEIPAQVSTLKIPEPGARVLHYAHGQARHHQQPVYVIYKARSGQLNNQLISFFNALVIAKRANATLIAPFAFYGSESYIDFAKNRSIFFFIRQYLDLHIVQPFLKQLGIFFCHDELVGDYLDGQLLNHTQPVVSMMQFLGSPHADYLRSYPHVLTRKGDAGFFYMTLGRRHFFQGNVHVRGSARTIDPTPGMENVSSRRELDCNFNISDYYRGLQYHAGVNGNFLFLSKLYRSHSLNCSASDPYWLDVRKYVQPREEIRAVVDEAIHKWGRVLTVHLRLFPFDLGKFSTDTFSDYFLTRFHVLLRKVDHMYIAHSVSSEHSAAIVSKLRGALGRTKIKTAQDFGELHSRGPVFNKGYAIPMVDMWMGVRSHAFVGRLGSSLSWNVVYWRDSFGYGQSTHQFYKLEDFSYDGEKNPTDSYGF